MRKRFVFVLGTGRSGTSTIARILHQHGIACMGHTFGPANEMNPLGYWEDLAVMPFIDKLTTGKMNTFVEKFEKAHQDHNCRAVRIGFKHPRLSAVGKSVWERLNPEAIFWAYRPREAAVSSMLRYRGFLNKDVTKRHTQYDSRLKSIQENVATLSITKKIDFSEHRSDSWALEQILSHLES